MSPPRGPPRILSARRAKAKPGVTGITGKRALPPNHDFTTIELKLNVFAAAALDDELICHARPLHIGRSTAVIEAEIRKGTRRVANLIVTQFVLPGRDPRAERPAPGDYPPGD